MKCRVSFCESVVDRANGGRAGLCNFHYRQGQKGRDPETAVKDPGWRRRHEVDESYFQTIDTPNKAYVLGFFMADGCMTGHCTISFAQHRDRSGLLEFIRGELQGGAESAHLAPMPRTDCLHLRINSKQMHTDLGKLGFSHRKTETCIFPSVDPSLYAPLLLGLFDGDGSIFSALPKRYRNRIWQVEWLGTYQVLLKIRAILANYCGGNPNASLNQRSGPCYRVSYCGNEQSERIGHFLYESNPPDYFLPQKHGRFQELYSRPPQAPQPGSLLRFCPQGHEYTEDNTYRDRKGHRSCLLCRRLRGRKGCWAIK